MWDVKPGFAEGSTPMEHENQFCFMHNPCVTSVNHTDVNTRHMCPFPKKSYDVKSCKIGKYKDHNPLYWGYPKKKKTFWRTPTRPPERLSHLLQGAQLPLCLTNRHYVMRIVGLLNSSRIRINLYIQTVIIRVKMS